MLKITPEMSATEIELHEALFKARLDAFHATNNEEREAAWSSAALLNEHLEEYQASK